jgi:hypothetical protein
MCHTCRSTQADSSSAAATSDASQLQQQQQSSTPLQQPEPGSFNTIIAFLQCGGRNSRIIPLCQQFQAVCEADAVGSTFAFLILPGMQLDDGVGLADSIRHAVQRALQGGKRGLVLLTGCRGGVGLDVKEVSRLILMMLSVARADAEPAMYCCSSNRSQAARHVNPRKHNHTDSAGCHWPYYGSGGPQQLGIFITSLQAVKHHNTLVHHATTVRSCRQLLTPAWSYPPAHVQIDVVWMLTDAPSTDSWMQRAFRCLTERRHGDVLRQDGSSLTAKTFGLVVDAYPHRVLQSLLEYCSIGSGQYSTPEQLLAVLVSSGVVRAEAEFCEGYTQSDEGSEQGEEGGAATGAFNAAVLYRALRAIYNSAQLLPAAANLQRVTLLQKQQLQLAPRQARLLSLDAKHAQIMMQSGAAAAQSAAASSEAASREGTAPPRDSKPDTQMQNQSPQASDQKVTAPQQLMSSKKSRRSLMWQSRLHALWRC